MPTCDLNSASHEFRSLVAKALAGEPVRITSEDGNVVMVSEADWEGIMETIALMGDPDFARDVEDSYSTPICECGEWNRGSRISPSPS